MSTGKNIQLWNADCAVEAAGKCEMRNGFKGRCVTRTEELTCSSWIVVEISKYFLQGEFQEKTKQIRK